MGMRSFVRPGRAAVISAVTIIALYASAGGARAATLLQISSDPFSNTTSQHATEVEPDTLSAGSTIVSAFQQGRFNVGGGASDIGFATSIDSGSTFTSGSLPGTTPYSSPAGVWQRVSDASVAFDAKHGVWLISFLGVFPGDTTHEVDVLTSRSTDGGFTWSTPIVINSSGHFNDKNWTACDDTASSPFYGNCYTEFDDNSLGDYILMSTSTDGGVTWGPALATGQLNSQRTHGIGGQPLVQPNGRVIVPILGFGARSFFVDSFTSDDGGASWSLPRAIAPIAYHTPAGGIRAGLPLPSAEIDAAGRVYLAWPDCRFEAGCGANDLVFSTTDDGARWSQITRIPLDPVRSGIDHFIPGLAVDRSTSGGSAHLTVAYYYYPDADCTAATCQLDVGASTSSTGGSSWTAGAQQAGPMTLSWLADTDQGRMVGDYISTSFAGSAAFPVFANASAPSGSTFDEAMFTVSGGISVSGGAAIAATDRMPAGAGQPQQTASSVTRQ